MKMNASNKFERHAGFEIKDEFETGRNNDENNLKRWMNKLKKHNMDNQPLAIESLSPLPHLELKPISPDQIPHLELKPIPPDQISVLPENLRESIFGTKRNPGKLSQLELLVQQELDQNEEFRYSTIPTHFRNIAQNVFIFCDI